MRNSMGTMSIKVSWAHFMDSDARRNVLLSTKPKNNVENATKVNGCH